MGMFTFLKVQAASIAGSIVDYLVTIVLVSGFRCWYLGASVAGNIFGAATLFVLCRRWIFRREKGSIRLQISRFILVFAGNMILASFGIYILTHFLKVHYIISKTIISILLGVSYNYLMQKKFVFG
jgi:putative flippase GtrA